MPPPWIWHENIPAQRGHLHNPHDDALGGYAKFGNSTTITDALVYIYKDRNGEPEMWLCELPDAVSHIPTEYMLTTFARIYEEEPTAPHPPEINKDNYLGVGVSFQAPGFVANISNPRYREYKKRSAAGDTRGLQPLTMQRLFARVVEQEFLFVQPDHGIRVDPGDDCVELAVRRLDNAIRGHLNGKSK